VRIARVHSPPHRISAALYVRLHPLALWHRLRVWQTRLRRHIWQSDTSLSHVRNAMRWGRQYRRHKVRFSDIDALRSILYADKTTIESHPLHPSVGTLARQISIKKKWGSFLYSLLRFSEAQRVLELGTGYGLSGLYIAQGMLECYPMRTCMFITLENDEDRIDKARHNFRRVGYDDFALVKVGDIAVNLAAALRDLKPPDLILMDGPADGELVQHFFAVIKAASFPGTLVIITNIHRTRKMMKSWHAIKDEVGLAATVDLWHWGIIVIGDTAAKPVHLWARL
jgi:predicted O-methyltransferase YrrM